MPKIHSKQISKELSLLRVDDDEVRYFEALWEIENGITYNSYLLTGEDEVILVDGWKREYADDFSETLKDLIDIRDITHVIVHHMEPDHSGSLAKILKENGFRAEVLGHPLVRGMMRAFYGIDVKFRAVKDGERLSLGGLHLEFFHTPWLHWPETIMTYLRGHGILFSGDAFGGFSIPPAIFDDDDEVVSSYLPFVREYISTIIGSYRQHIPRNVKKLMDQRLEIRMIAPAHGLIWRKNPERIIEYYLKIADGIPEEGKVLVIYASMYGSCEEAGNIVAEELKKQGKRVITYGFTDVRWASINKIIGDAVDSESLIIIAPTYENAVFPTISHVADLIARKIPPNKPILVLSSHGWAGVAGKKLAERFRSANFSVIDVMEFKGKPDEDVKKRILESVSKLLSQSSTN